MSAVLVSLLFTAGFSTWLYTKLQRRGGMDNTRQSVIAAGVVGLILFFVLWSILSLIF